MLSLKGCIIGVVCVHRAVLMSPEPCKAINAKEILGLYIAFNVPVLY